MYPSEWHRIYGDRTGESARRILPPLVEQFAARSVVEIGCGHGHWAQVASENGVADLLAIDGPWNDREQLLVDRPSYREVNLGQPLALERRYDLAICLEVAEHVAADSAATLVRSLVDAAPVVLFGAAIPLQGGHGHINEQWPSYWRALFAELGYRPYDLVRPRHWQDRQIHYWYRQNCFVYVNQADAEATRRAASEAAETSLDLMDAVHPEKFEEVASYRSIAFKRFVNAFPDWAKRRLREKLTGRG